METLMKSSPSRQSLIWRSTDDVIEEDKQKESNEEDSEVEDDEDCTGMETV